KPKSGPTFTSQPASRAARIACLACSTRSSAVYVTYRICAIALRIQRGKLLQLMIQALDHPRAGVTRYERLLQRFGFSGHTEAEQRFHFRRVHPEAFFLIDGSAGDGGIAERDDLNTSSSGQSAVRDRVIAGRIRRADVEQKRKVAAVVVIVLNEVSA